MRRSRPTHSSGRLAAVVSALALVAAIAMAVAVPASAAESSPLQIRRVDTTDTAASSLQFLFNGSGADATGATLTEGGSGVDAARAVPLPDSERLAVALVFDTSSAMDTSGALVSAKDAAKKWISGRSTAEQANQLVAVYTAGELGQRVQDFTADTARIVAAIDRVAPSPEATTNEDSALWSAVQQAGDNLATQKRYQSNLVIMTGSSDTVGGSQSAASGAIATAGASVFAVELVGQGLNTGSIDSLVSTYGGYVYSTDSGTDFGDLVTDAGTAIDDQQYSITFTPNADIGSVADLSLAVGDQTATAAVVVGSNVVGAQALNPTIDSSSGGISFLQGSLGLFLLIVVGLIAVIGLAYGVMMIFVRQDRLANALQPYDDALGASPLTDDDDDDPLGSAFARTAIVQRAVQFTEQVAEQRGFLSRTEVALERANLPLRAGEALFFYAAIVVVVTFLALILTSSLIFGLILGGMAAAAPIADGELPGQPSPQGVHGPAAGHALAPGRHLAGRLLTHAGRGGRLPGGGRAHGLRAAPGGHRGPPRPSPRGGPRRHRRAHGQPRLRLGGHGHPHPAGGGRQPLRAPAHRGRDDDPARAPAP